MSMDEKSDKHVKVRFGTVERGESLDPSNFRFSKEYIYIENLTVRLLEMNKKGQYVGQLADKIELSRDQTELKISLKEAKFSDGSPILAKDVVNSFKRVLLNGSPHSDPKSFIEGGDSITSIDDSIPGLVELDCSTLLIRLKQPTKEIFYFLQLGDYGILSPTQVRKKTLKVKDWSETLCR